MATDAGGVEGLSSEEDGTVMVRDDLDALLQVCHPCPRDMLISSEQNVPFVVSWQSLAITAICMQRQSYIQLS